MLSQRGLLGRLAELEAAQQATRFAGRKSLVERAGRVRRQIVQDDADALGCGT